MIDLQTLQEPLPQTDLPALAPAELEVVPIPSSSTYPAFKSSSSITPLISDERAILRLLETLLHRGGLSAAEAARRLGVRDNAVRQYTSGRRHKPSLMWFIKFAEACGAKVIIEFPRGL